MTINIMMTLDVDSSGEFFFWLQSAKMSDVNEIIIKSETYRAADFQ